MHRSHQSRLVQLWNSDYWVRVLITRRHELGFVATRCALHISQRRNEMGMFSRRSAGYLVMAAGLALALTGPSLAQSQGQEVTIRDHKQLVESLRSGGYVIVVRHGATFSDQADTDPFNFDNIAKQRNLNEKGKELAKAFGDAIRQVGIP